MNMSRVRCDVHCRIDAYLVLGTEDKLIANRALQAFKQLEKGVVSLGSHSTICGLAVTVDGTPCYVSRFLEAKGGAGK